MFCHRFDLLNFYFERNRIKLRTFKQLHGAYLPLKQSQNILEKHQEMINHLNTATSEKKNKISNISTNFPIRKQSKFSTKQNHLQKKLYHVEKQANIRENFPQPLSFPLTILVTLHVYISSWRVAGRRTRLSPLHH